MASEQTFLFQRWISYKLQICHLGSLEFRSLNEVFDGLNTEVSNLSGITNPFRGSTRQNRAIETMYPNTGCFTLFMSPTRSSLKTCT